MKKFLVFLISMIVVICLGMTFYYFAQDEERIKIKTSTIYLNVGESISLEDLDFSHIKKKKETRINFNAGGDAVTSIIRYDSNAKKYVTTGKGGSTTIVITTNNRRFKRFEIDVVVGNGTEASPFHITNEEELFAIGSSKYDTTPDNGINDAMTAYYKQMNDITIQNSHKSIGIDLNEEFNGTFDGNYYSINNMAIESGNCGGLFAVIGVDGKVINAKFNNSTLVGDYTYCGTIAGQVFGYLDRIVITNSNIKNQYNGTSYTGGIAGTINFKSLTSEIAEHPAIVQRISLDNASQYTISGKDFVGGIAGLIEKSNIHAIKINSLVSSTNNYCGGFAGKIVFDQGYGYVYESYSLATVTGPNSKTGGLFGLIETNEESSIDKYRILLGLYYRDNGLNTYASCNISDLGLNSNYLLTIKPKADSELKQADTFIFYKNSENTNVMWKSTVWKCTNIDYPVLRFTETSIPSNIEDAGNINNPNISTNPIVNPDKPVLEPSQTTEIYEINSPSTLMNAPFDSTYKQYKLTSSINMAGYSWAPRKLINTTFISTGDYEIYNISINSDSEYCGFFSSISNATISDIKFNHISITVNSNNKYVGIIAGQANYFTMTRCSVLNSQITAPNYGVYTEYTGGLIGGITDFTSSINTATSNVTINGNFKNAGGAVGLIGSNTVLNSITQIGSVSAHYFLGGIAGQNKGLIENSTSYVTLNSVRQNSGYSYIGGIAGANFSTIDNAITTAEITIANIATDYNYSIGGITGYNVNGANIYESTLNETSKIDFLCNNSISFVGGIAGTNQGRIEKCLNKADRIGADMKQIYVGGLVGANRGGLLFASKTTAELIGDYVGGIAYRNNDKGSIQQCAVGSNSQRVSLKGDSVAGIVHSVINGEVKNCLAIVSTYGLKSNSETAGLVIYFPSSANDYGTISYCIVSDTYDGYGQKYFTTPTEIFSSYRCSGTILNCVLENTFAYKTNLQTYDKFFWFKLNSASGSSFLSAKLSDMKTLSTYKDFQISNATSTIWIMTAQLPELSLLTNLH